MTSFKCKRSGNVISFSNPMDIESLRKSESYIEIKEIQNYADEKPIEKVLKKRGRPARSSI